MLQSKLFTKTLREPPAGEIAVNAQLMERAGFVYKNSAGVYTYLPLGWRVLQNIARIIREEMNAIGAQELFMPALVEKKYLDATGRWDVEVGFEALGKGEKQASFVMGWTHEEVLTEIASRFVSSYKDLPFAAYQIQTKFRNEPRAKSGLLRGREFMMKDLYSFHATQEDFERYYETVRDAYVKIFERCGLRAVYTLAAGGDFTASNTHEFQVACPTGEDTVFICTSCNYAENGEISTLQNGDTCSRCGKGNTKEEKAIEVGNIFPLGTKYSKAFNLQFTAASGKKDLVIMGSYGIGLGRVMATVVETHHDEKGIIWPESIAPFAAHLVLLSAKAGDAGTVTEAADTLYDRLTKAGISVLYDDRESLSAGEKFADCDLMGIPLRLVVSAKTLEKSGVELKMRTDQYARIIDIENIVSVLKK